MPRHKLLFFALASLILIIAGFFFSLPLINKGRIVYGMKIANQKIGGLKFSEAENLLNQKIEEFEGSKIIFSQQGKEVSATSQELGIKIPLKTNMDSLKSIGRAANFWLGLWQQFSTCFAGRKAAIIYQWDKETFQKFWGENEKVFVSNPPQDTTLTYDFANQEFTIIPGKEGQSIDYDSISQELIENILSLKTKQIKITLQITQPLIFQNQQTEQAKDKAEAILELAPYTISTKNFSQRIHQYQLIDWLNFEPVHKNDDWVLGVTFDEEKIKKYLEKFSPALEQEPVNAQVALRGEKITIFSLAKDGQTLNIEKSTQAFKDNVMAGNKKIELVFDKISPTIKTDSNIIKLGLTSFLAQGESNFSGSPNNRVHNIKIGAKKISGTLVEPGKEFSLIDSLGNIGPAEGYLPELVIKKDKTIPEYGGGLCQISTTLFRAAINSGLKITERAPHAFPVVYYSPQGFDATIYPPHPDLRFINDTPANILIQSKIIGTRLIFEIYGTQDNRQVKVKGPYVLESNPDGSMKTVLYQEIWQNEALERKSTFHSNYKSPALYPVEKNPLE